jgi:hypothetical protein
MKMAEDIAHDSGLIVVPEPGGLVSFRGHLIHMVSTRSGNQPRWTELYLYKVTDGQGGYVLANIGKSVLYHTVGGPCNLGVRKTVDSLSDEEFQNLEPHTMTIQRYPGDPKTLRPCHPADLETLDPREIISVELDLPGVTRCPTAASIREELRQVRREQGMTVGFLSEPAQRLLREAADIDPDIAAALREVRPL